MEGQVNAECGAGNGESGHRPDTTNVESGLRPDGSGHRPDATWCDHEFADTRHCIVCGKSIDELSAELALYQRMQRTLDLVAAERARQRALLEDGVIEDDCSDLMVNDFIKLGVLAEEFGEASRAANKLQELMRRPGADVARLLWRRKNLRMELIQTAAVAVAWAESLEGETELQKEQNSGKAAS